MVAEKVKQLEQENISLKAQIEELQNICGTNASVPMNCEYCRNFIQHYIKIDAQYSPICSGHCVAGKQTKSRRTDDTCKAFVRKTYGRNHI